MRLSVIIFSFIIFVASCDEPRRYEKLSDQFSILEQSGDFENAGDLIRSKISLFPEREFDLIKELIYINEKLGNYKENLDIFRESHKKGYFFLIHPALPKYKPYLELKGFSDISEYDMNLRDSAISKAGTVIKIIEPSGFKKKKEYPVLFVFHGGGSNLLRASDNWISDKIERHFIRVFLQSPRHSDYNTFGWRNSDSIAIDLLEEAYLEVKNSYKIDLSDIIVAGISAGGTSAIYSAFSSDLPVTRVIAICPGIPELLDGSDYLKKEGVELVIIAGESDHYRPRQERLADSLSRYNMQYIYNVIPGMGHEYPADFTILLNSLL